MEQTHSADVVEVDLASDNPTCDGIITRVKTLGLAVLAADCVPLLLKSRECVGAVHVGRKGMEKKIATRAISMMREMGAGEITAFIGPSVCGRCYEVSPEMYREVISQIPESATRDDIHCLDIKAGLAAELELLNISMNNLDICTMENSDFFSHRVSASNGLPEGRQVGVISL